MHDINDSAYHGNQVEAFAAATLEFMPRKVGQQDFHDEATVFFWDASHSRQVKARMPDSTGDFRVRLSL